MSKTRSSSDLVGLLPAVTATLSWLVGRNLQWAVYGLLAGSVVVLLWSIATGRFSGASRCAADMANPDDGRIARDFNPATGLLMPDRYGQLDVGGNSYGTSDASGLK